MRCCCESTYPQFLPTHPLHFSLSEGCPTTEEVHCWVRDTHTAAFDHPTDQCGEQLRPALLTTLLHHPRQPQEPSHSPPHPERVVDSGPQPLLQPPGALPTTPVPQGGEWVGRGVFKTLIFKNSSKITSNPPHAQPTRKLKQASYWGKLTGKTPPPHPPSSRTTPTHLPHPATTTLTTGHLRLRAPRTRATTPPPPSPPSSCHRPQPGRGMGTAGERWCLTGSAIPSS